MQCKNLVGLVVWGGAVDHVWVFITHLCLSLQCPVSFVLVRTLQVCCSQSHPPHHHHCRGHRKHSIAPEHMVGSNKPILSVPLGIM